MGFWRLLVESWRFECWRREYQRGRRRADTRSRWPQPVLSEALRAELERSKREVRVSPIIADPSAVDAVTLVREQAAARAMRTQVAASRATDALPPPDVSPLEPAMVPANPPYSWTTARAMRTPPVIRHGRPAPPPTAPRPRHECGLAHWFDGAIAQRLRAEHHRASER